MYRISFIVFVIILSSTAVFSQGTYDEFLKDQRFKNEDTIEKRCYETTRSYSAFKNCVENGRLPICPKGEWDVDRQRRDFPCIYEREPFDRKLTEVPEYVVGPYETTADRKAAGSETSIENSRAFVEPFPPFVKP